jgi:hypothetical protein
MSASTTKAPRAAAVTLTPGQRIGILETQAETVEVGMRTMRTDLDDGSARLRAVEADLAFALATLVRLCDHFGVEMPERLAPPA